MTVGGASRGGKAVFISLDPRLRKDDGRGGEARRTAGGVLRVVVFFTGGDPLPSYPRMRAAGVKSPYFCNFIKFLKTTTYGLNDRVSLFLNY